MEKQPSVYILAHRRYGVLYTGVTSDLIGRIWQHRTHAIEGFTAKFQVTQAGLVRVARHDGFRHYAGETHQEVAA